MGKFLKQITEDTTVSIGVVVIIVGAMVWLTELHSETSENSSDIKDIKSMQQDTQKQFEEIRVRLTHIEDAVIDH